MASVHLEALPTSSKSFATPEIFDVVVVGGGLSGLVIAASLPKTINWLLVEAHPNRLGGRLLNTNSGIDMGAAWVWPHHQPHMSRLIGDLKLKTFDQPDDQSSTRLRGGAYAIVEKLASNLNESRIRKGWVLESCALVTENRSCAATEGTDRTDQDGESNVQLTFKGGSSVLATKYAVLAVPPKLLSESVHFFPALPSEKWAAMERSRTWMAGVTKVALTFPERFWPLHGSNMGLPGRPAFQVYDSGGAASERTPGSLTFFTLAPSSGPGSGSAPPPQAGAPPPSSTTKAAATEAAETSATEAAARRADDSALATQCAQQLASVWERGGLRAEASRLRATTANHLRAAAAAAAEQAAAAAAGEPASAAAASDLSAASPAALSMDANGVEVAVQRWPLEAFVGGQDRAPSTIHPHPHPVRELGAPAWGGELLFASTESDQVSPGVMEGSVGAAKRVVASLKL